jgi:hypothetical protein
MIHHFYHIYADGNWLEPVSEHIRAMKQYGLYDVLETFAIGVVGSRDNRHAVKQYLLSQGLTYVIANEQDHGWEQVTQVPMWEFCQNHDGLILYAHTKGASNSHDVNIRWRRSMIWHNVCQWRVAVEKLKDHKTYGSHWVQPLIDGMPEHKQGNFMYAGTFFWAHCDLVRTFMKPPMTHRHEAEGWVGYKYAEEPWPVWDCTPYFPNTDIFMDGWLSDPNYNPEDRGKSIAPMKTVNEIVV